MTTPRTTWKALSCGALLFVAVDLAVFRSGLYAWIARPESSAGWMVRRTRFDPWAQPAVEQPSVLLLGDSTMASACSPEQLRTLLGGMGTMRNAAVPGSTPRVWPFLFAQVPAPPDGWRIVVVGLRDYDDDGSGDDFSQRLHDLSFLGASIGLADANTIASEFDTAAARRDVWLAAISRVFAWRRDLQDLFAAPWQRYLDVRRQFGRLDWGQPFLGTEGSMAGVHVEGDRIVGLEAAQESEREKLEQLVWPQHRVDNSIHRRRWLGELADRVTATGAQLLLLRMPSQVLPRIVPRVPRTTVVDELARRPGVHVLPYDTFTELERSDCFFDALHLNRSARERFTTILADRLQARCARELGR